MAALGLGLASLTLPSCGGSGPGKQSTGSGGSNGSGSGGNGNNPDGGGNGSGGSGNNGTGGKGNSGTGGSGNNGTGGMVVINPPPAAKCMGAVSEAAATALDFSTNLIASPSPPGSLTPATAPQLVVFGWDDIESQAGITFVSSLFTGVTNP
ncbi:MAG TPA: hypothetical protein VGL59_15540, partial [Polyangia bacterium]